MTTRVLIVGAGHAGGSAAALLRQYGFEGEITLVGAEPLAPYQRPPLSKAWLKGEADGESLLLKPLEFYAENGIALRLGLTATRINRAAKTVTFNDGHVLPYDILILATGARARRLDAPGSGLTGVLELRDAADADQLKAALQPGRRLAVVGGGYVGLEVAASARALGCEVTVIEREPRLLARVASEPLSAFFANYHAAKGVQIITDATVEAFGGHGVVENVRLAGGGQIGCDITLVGIGGVANVELARDAGLSCLDGVVVDIEARTEDPAIFAIGDMTHRPMPLYGRNFRLESVPNALEQARQAACAIVGRPAPAGEVPWFWSDQYDLKLQIAGTPFDADRLVLRGEPGRAPLAVFHLRGDRVMAVEAVNAPAEFMGGRLLIAKGLAVDLKRLADPSVAMKALTAS